MSKDDFIALLRKASKTHMAKQEVEGLWKRVCKPDGNTADRWVVIELFLEELGVRLGILREDGGGPASPVNRKRGSNAYFLES